MQRKNVYDRHLTFKELREMLTAENVNERAYGGIGGTALNAAALEIIDCQKRLELCMKLGANLNVQNSHPQDPFFNTPLHLLISNESYADTLAFFQLAKKYQLKIDFNIKDRQGKTPLVLACKLRHIGLANAILNEKKLGADVDVNIADDLGNTALHYACALGMTDIARLLVQMGADVHKENNKRRTPLDMTKTTAEDIRGIFSTVDVNPDRDENSPHDLFTDQYNQFFVDLDRNEMIKLCANKSNLGELKRVLGLNLADMRRFFNERVRVPMTQADKHDILAKTEIFSGKSVLESCLEKQKDVMEFMLSLKVNAGFVFRSAASANQLKEMELIFKHQPEVLNSAGKPSLKTALHYAADKNSVGVSQFLLKQGADTTLLDEGLNTPLHLACAKGNIEIVKLLLDAKCFLDHQNKDKRTPWQLLQEVLSKSALNEKVRTEMETLFAMKRETHPDQVRFCSP